MRAGRSRPALIGAARSSAAGARSPSGRVTAGAFGRSTGMRRLAAPLALALAAFTLAACGEEERETPAAPPAQELTVDVTEAGDPQTIACADGCDEQAIAEVVASTQDTMRACTELYGGPETAHLTGTLDGEPVDVTITRNDGCGVADYDALFEALGVQPPLAR
jgi:hypothetical protein